MAAMPGNRKQNHAPSTAQAGGVDLGGNDLGLAVGGDALPRLSTLTSGDFAQQLIRHQLHRLGRLQAGVLADNDPEPLHQFRVSLRRLRTILRQFGPAIRLPSGVHERRIAAVARRTSLCRDLDVLGLRLKRQLLPRIPEPEQRQLQRAIKRLARDRRRAFNTLVDELHSDRYRQLLERLSSWQLQPRFTALGQLPLLPWLFDWQAPFSAGLFLHPGWSEHDPAAEELHGLRKLIKTARYSLETLKPWCDAPLLAWIDNLRLAQDHLGELHDFQILSRHLRDTLKPRHWDAMPVLQAELHGQQLYHWLCWRQLAEPLLHDVHRSKVQGHLLELGRCASWPP